MLAKPGITPDQFGAVLLKPDEVKRAQEIAAQISVESALEADAFALATEGRMSEIDPLLERTAVKDTTFVGDQLLELLESFETLKPESFLDLKEDVWGKLWVVGKYLNVLRRQVRRYRSQALLIEQNAARLEITRDGLIQDAAMLEKIEEINASYYREVLIYLHAGEILLEKFQAERDSLQSATDPDSIDRMMILDDIIEALNNRLHDLKLIAFTSWQAGPQIRGLQKVERIMANKISSTIMVAVPIWKRTTIQALATIRLLRAIELQKKARRITSDMIINAAKQWRVGIRTAMAEQYQGVVEIAALKQANDEMVAGIKEAAEAARQGQQDQAQALNELESMRQKLTSTILKPDLLFSPRSGVYTEG